METLGKTNGSEPLSVEVVSKVDEILSDFFGKLDNAIQSFVKQHCVDADAPSNSALDQRIAELFDRLDNVVIAVNGLEDNYREAALEVCGENDEGFVREDDMPDQISRHCGVTLDPDEISELIKKTVVEILLHNVCIGIEPHGDPKLESAVLD